MTSTEIVSKQAARGRPNHNFLLALTPLGLLVVLGAVVLLACIAGAVRV